MKAIKRIWELQSSTVCKVVGMALHLRDLRKIARKFGIAKDDPLMDEEFILHSTVVRLCSTDNIVARHTEKTLEKRFVLHAKKISFEDPIQLIRCVKENSHDVQAPLWAVLWGLATRGRLADARIENALFGFIHMLEHRLVRDYWKSLPAEENGTESDMDRHREILSLRRDLLDMQWANTKLEKIIENLRSRVASQVTADDTPAIGAPTVNTTADTHSHTDIRRVRNLKGLLAQAKYCNQELEAENAQLRDEIEALLAELNSAPDCPGDTAREVSQDDGRLPLHLEGRRVALVGGIESLECHYRQVVESVGGNFSRHDGDNGGSARGLQECILGADLVVCPVEVNSHNAAKAVKRMCKECGVPCCFPRTASITGLRKAMEEHYSSREVA